MRGYPIRPVPMTRNPDRCGRCYIDRSRRVIRRADIDRARSGEDRAADDDAPSERRCWREAGDRDGGCSERAEAERTKTWVHDRSSFRTGLTAAAASPLARLEARNGMAATTRSRVA